MGMLHGVSCVTQKSDDGLFLQHGMSYSICARTRITTITLYDVLIENICAYVHITYDLRKSNVAVVISRSRV